MGFRCPNCSKDFGLSQEALHEHFSNNTECASEAGFIKMKTEFISNLNVPKKKRKIEHTSKGMYKLYDIRANNVKRQHEFIGDHNWKKLNIVSNEDGSDDVECNSCGLKAKRFGNSYQFDKRTSANKIENCKQKK